MALAVPPERWPQRQRFDQAMAASGITWKVCVEAQGWDLLARLAELGVAPAIVNEHEALPAGLRKLPIKDLPSVPYVALTRWKPNKFTAELIGHLRVGVRRAGSSSR